MTEIKVSRRRKQIAENLEKSLKIPWASCEIEVDISKLRSRCESLRYKLESAFLYTIAEAALYVPEANVRWEEKESKVSIHQFENVDIGLALDAKGGLVVYPIPAVDTLTLGKLDKWLRELALKAESGNFSLNDFEVLPNFLLNNVGCFPNILRGAPIQQPWNTIMVTTFRAERKVVPVPEQGIGIRPIMNVLFTFDHRPLDGGIIAKFANVFKEKIENPRF